MRRADLGHPRTAFVRSHSQTPAEIFAMSDPEFESLKREIDLAQYARSIGYVDKPRDSMPGIVVLEHQRLGDRIAVARCERGGIYARIPDYSPRTQNDSEDRARLRLRDAIMRSNDTGSILEFVRSRERMAGRPEPELQRVREHLAAWQQVTRDLRADAQRVDLGRRMGDWGPSPLSLDRPTGSEVQARLQRWEEAQRLIDRKLAPQRSAASMATTSSSPADGSKKSEAALRRYDWSPAPIREGVAGRTAPTRRDHRDPDQGRGR